MIKMHKYPLSIAAEQVVRFPSSDFSVRHVGIDGLGQLCLWAEVEADEYGRAPQRKSINDPLEDSDVRVWIVGTGQEIPARVLSHADYTATVTVGAYVWHVYCEEGPS